MAKRIKRIGKRRDSPLLDGYNDVEYFGRWRKEDFVDFDPNLYIIEEEEEEDEYSKWKKEQEKLKHSSPVLKDPLNDFVNSDHLELENNIKRMKDKIILQMEKEIEKILKNKGILT